MEPGIKNWWESRTIIAGLVAIIASALSMMGIEVPFSEQIIMADIAFELATIIASGVAVWGRVIATKKIAPVIE
jgi:hypothetical protein